MYTHTNTCTRIRTYIEVTYTHTLKQSFDTRNDAWRESADMTRVFAKRSKHREVRTAQGTFVNWNHRSGSVTSKAAHENERVADCKFAEESNIRSLARALFLLISLARVCVWVCMPGQARGAQRASINMFAWPQRVKCLRRLLYVQHAAMCNMSQWRRRRCCRHPLPLCTLHLSSLQSPQTSNVHNHFRRVQLQQQTIGLRTSGQTQHWAQLKRVNGWRGVTARVFYIALFSYLAFFVFLVFLLLALFKAQLCSASISAQLSQVATTTATTIIV